MNTVNNAKAKKAAILFGSPNNQGNTSKLLDEFLRFCPEETQAKLLCAYDLTLEPCIGCDRCKTTGQCFRATADDFREIDKAVHENDIFILASPVYFLGFPAPLKLIIDRFQPYFYQKPFHNLPKRKAVLLTTSGSNDDSGPKQLAASAKYMFDSINVSLVDHVSVKNTDKEFTINSSACQRAAKALFQD